MRSLIVGVLLTMCGLGSSAARQADTPQVVGYVFAQNAILQPGQVDPENLTRINYAFANIDHGQMVEGFSHDAENFAFLNGLKAQSPNVKVMVSVGGWLWSTNFSDVSLTQQSRDIFIESVMDFLTRYKLDGLDIDWEYPGMAGSGHPFRAEDKQNFTLLLKGLRKRFDEQAVKSHHRLLLTMAAGSSDEFIEHTEMAKVAQLVDTVNLMAYDYYEPESDATTGNHAPLFTDSADPKKVSGDTSVKAFEKAGVPAAKILLGVPFYGHVWGQVADHDHGLFQAGKPIPNAYAQYSAITQTMIGQGYTRYWDSASSVPYLYNADKQIFVSYEDPESLAAKSRYVRQHGLGGVMFWEYSGDPSGTLPKVIHDSLVKKEASGVASK